MTDPHPLPIGEVLSRVTLSWAARVWHTDCKPWPRTGGLSTDQVILYVRDQVPEHRSCAASFTRTALPPPSSRPNRLGVSRYETSPVSVFAMPSSSGHRS